MADRLLLESGAPDGYLLEDGTGVLSLDGAYAVAVLALGPVAYWRLSENGTTIAVDISGNGHNGTYQVSASSVAGGLTDDSNGAVSFNGSTQWITVSDHTDFDFGDGPQSGTIWARRVATGDSYQVLMASGGAGSLVAGIQNATSKVRLATEGDTDIIQESGTTPADGEWHFWAWTRSGGGTGNTKLYKDGVDVTSELTTDTVVNSATGPTIGDSVSGTWRWNGDLDEAAIYDYVLSPAEIANLYAIGTAASSSAEPYYDALIALSPVAYWRLNDGDGATVAVAEVGGAGLDGAYILPGITVPYGATATDPDDGQRFNGTGGVGLSGITLPDDAALDLGNAPMSFTFWARRRTGGAGALQGVIERQSTGYGIDFDIALDKVSFVSTATTTIARESGTSTIDGLWHHYVITRAGSSSGQTLIYKDGVEGTTFLGVDTLTDPAGNTFIARGYTTSQRDYSGDLDEFAIFNYVLSAGEISDLYDAGSINTSGNAYARPAEATGEAGSVEPGGFPRLIESAHDSGSGGSQTTHALLLTQLSEINAGDLIIAFAGRDGTGTSTWNSPWVELIDQQFTDANITAGYLIASGGETTTNIDFTLSERGTYLMLRIEAGSWDPASVPEVNTAVNHSGTAPNPGSITPSWGAANTLWLTVIGSDVINVEPVPPTDYQLVDYTSITDTSSAGYVAVARRLANAASMDAGAWTTNSETMTAFTIAVRPAPVSADEEAAAELIAVSGAANNAWALVKINAALATAATGLSNASTIRISANAGIATATGLANAALTKPAAQAQVATATGVALNVIPLLKPNAGLASGTGAAHAPPVHIAPRAAIATASGSALDATVSTATPQILRPIADLSGNWHGEDARTTTLYTSVDDSPFSDSTYVESPMAPTSSDFHEFDLPSAADPLSSSDHQVRYRYGGEGTATLVVELRQGTTVIASWSHVDPTTPTTVTQTLTGPEADAITDYTDLRIRVRGV